MPNQLFWMEILRRFMWGNLKVLLIKAKRLSVKRIVWKKLSRAWYNKIDSYLLLQGFRKSTSETTLYVRATDNFNQLILSLFVDEILVTRNNCQMLQDFKVEMERMFEMSTLGYMFVGMEIHPHKGICIAESKYAQENLKKFKIKLLLFFLSSLFVASSPSETVNLGLLSPPFWAFGQRFSLLAFFFRPKAFCPPSSTISLISDLPSQLFAISFLLQGHSLFFDQRLLH